MFQKICFVSSSLHKMAQWLSDRLGSGTPSEERPPQTELLLQRLWWVGYLLQGRGALCQTNEVNVAYTSPLCALMSSLQSPRIRYILFYQKLCSHPILFQWVVFICFLLSRAFVFGGEFTHPHIMAGWAWILWLGLSGVGGEDAISRGCCLPQRRQRFSTLVALESPRQL